MQQPLAYLLKPTTIEDIIGQEHLLHENGLIRRMVAKNYVSSLIFYGEPGIGKSSLALALANDLKIPYAFFNAEIDKKQDLEKILTTASKNDRFIVILEEIHRMNRDKQDILLKYLEQGNILMFACTTENPFFVINPAIRSRANIIKLERISAQEMADGLQRLITKHPLLQNLKIGSDSINIIAKATSGDLRLALNILELCLNLYDGIEITPKILKNIIPNANLLNNADGDEHHDLKSALQKSIRGSDVDAALYYFARLLASGDHEALMRRMLIMAYEDIGLANPAIAIHVKAAIDAFRQIGLPEGRIPLGLAIVEMALSEKSNSAYLATDQAYEDVLSGKEFKIPLHLKDTHYKSAKKLGAGKGYKYPHDFPNDYVEQTYLPPEMEGVKYYVPKKHSIYEKRINDLYEIFTKKKK
ncbi:replication-associated recombination protein A [Spiroplasma chrysopicola]|uniref:Recombination factor protein RarA n=1 Tax=Spiroplasma chrysopicola DF-1 TaxID=1276227 RepID=R4UAM5_9MOLU|nr:replication-associated recombination protein A [Spiroplasma chrysopicola]AGM24964.1 recombination factor protein RarA [Spiroplasma chrysopicola DF-1]